MDEAREAAFRNWDSAPENRRYADLDSAFDAGWDAGVAWMKERCATAIAEPFTSGQYRQERGIAPPAEREER